MTTGEPTDIPSLFKNGLGPDKGPSLYLGFAFGVEGEGVPPGVTLGANRFVNNSGILARGVSLLSISSPSNVLSACPL